MKTQAIAALLLASTLPAQGLLLEPCGGAIGQNITYKVSGGKSGQQFALLTSLQRTVTPLSMFDGGETRSLGVGLDLVGIMLLARFDTQGEFSLTAKINNLPALAGANILNQAVSLGGATTAFDKLSAVTVVSLELPKKWVTGVNKMPKPRAFSSTIPLGDGRVMIAGGGGGWLMWQGSRNTTEIFDPFTRKFTAGPNMTVPRSSHTQTKLKDGRYLLTGGVTKSGTSLYLVTNSCEIYNPKTHKFTAVKSMAKLRCMHTAALLPNGKVIVVGGNEDVSSNQNWGFKQLSTTEIYDPTTNSWTYGPSMSIRRSGHAMQDLGNGKFLILGGIYGKSKFSYPVIQTSCQLYNSSTSTFGSAASMATSRAFPATFLMTGSKVLVAGGMSGVFNNSGGTGTATNLCQIYDIAKNSWSNTASLPKASAGAGSIKMRDGRYAVLGGGSVSLNVPTPTGMAVAYNQTTAKWEALPTMNIGRIGGMAYETQTCGLMLLGGGIGLSGRATESYELLVR